MALLDRAGRVLSRIFGFRSADRVQAQRSIAESRLDKIVSRERDTLRKMQQDREKAARSKRVDPYEELRQKIKADQRKAFREFQDELERQKIEQPLLREEPSTAEPTIAEVTPYRPEWILVSSSNVEKMRWVGGSWGLQVGFKNGYLYEYAVAYTTYLEMLESPSKGKFVWWMRRSGVAYRRYNPRTIPPRIIYRWGHIGGPTSPSEYERPPQGVSRGPKQYDPNLGGPGAPVVP